MILINKKITGRSYGHNIEAVITHISAELGISSLKTDSLYDGTLGNTYSHIADGIAQDEKSGDFRLTENIGGFPVDIVGSWRIIPDYQDIHRLLAWDYNRASSPDESLTEEDFKKTFSNGSHYFEKFTHTMKGKLIPFLEYIGKDHMVGQRFMSMLSLKVDAYEKRVKKPLAVH